MISSRLFAATTLLFSAGYANAAAPANDEPWRPIARACAEAAIQQQCPNGGTCGDTWPSWAACTLENAFGAAGIIAAKSERFNWCVQKIWTERWNNPRMCANCGDPVKETISCVGGE